MKHADVFVETDDGMTYSLVVTTPKNYYWYMDKEGIDFIPATPPDIIVRCLSADIISKAIETFIEDEGYWIKLYFLAGKRTGAFDSKAMNEMIEEIKSKNEEIFGKQGSKD